MKQFFVILAVFLGSLALSSAKIRSDCACGESNEKGVGRIVNGKTAMANKYPWMAAMFTPQAFMCGGAIISDRTILTAGHCVFYVPDPMTTYWVLGMHDQRTKDGEAFNVGYFELHPKFANHTNYDDYDIAMVALTRKIIFGLTIRPICLPPANADYTGLSAIVAGWGRLSDLDNAKMAALLQETKIKVKPFKQCVAETKRLVKFNAQSMICGYEPNKDACQGDSGGPFFIETSPNRYEVIGVVSFGDGCARKFPGIYGRISEPSTLKWINSFIKRANGDVCRDLEKAKKPKTFLDELVGWLSPQ